MATITGKRNHRRTHIQARLWERNPYDEIGLERAAIVALTELNKAYGTDREMIAQALIALQEKHHQGWKPPLKHDVALDKMTALLDSMGGVLSLLTDIANKMSSGEIIAPVGYQAQIQDAISRADPRFASLGVPVIEIDIDESDLTDDW